MATFSAGSDGQSKEWSQVYDEIKKDYEEAYSCIDKAIKLDEDGTADEAVSMYEFGLNIIDKALAMPIECPPKPDITWEKTYVMIQKMRKTRKEITIRIDQVKAKPHPDSVAPPPSYEEAMAACPKPSECDKQIPSSSKSNVPYVPPSAIYDSKLVEDVQSTETENANVPPSYADLSNELNAIQLSTSKKEILYRHDNVRLYFIAPDGRVSATSEPDTLIIARIEDATGSVLDETLVNIVDQLNLETSSKHKKRHHHRRHHLHRRRHRHHRDNANRSGTQAESEGQVYLQVGSWVYPLIPGVSPCFRSEFGAFILPDVHSGIVGAAVGLILPQDADESVYALLCDILNGDATSEPLKLKALPHRRARRSERSGLSTDYSAPQSSLSASIIKGASYLANNLVRGAGNTARFVDATTPRIIDKIHPKEQPINPTVQKSFQVAKNVSGTVSNASFYLTSKIRVASNALGRYLAPQIHRTGTFLLTSTTSMSESEASKKLDTMLDVTAGAVEGVATIYNGLEDAAAILGNSLSNNTVQIIEYKYGQPAGALTSDAFATIGNANAVRRDLKVLKPKGLIKTTAKSAGKAVMHERRTSKPHEEFEGPGPGDGSGFRPEKS